MKAPLVSFLLIAYNQEEYIEKAVSAALAQDYKNLEFVFCDDASTDTTFDRLQSLVEQFPHRNRVTTIRNETNRGLVGNLNRGLRACSGDLIVVAAGDDVSAPYRVRTLVKAWLRHDRPLALYSDFLTFEEDDELTGFLNRRCPERILSTVTSFKANEDPAARFLRKRGGLFAGCSAAYSKDLFQNEWYLPETAQAEDVPLFFRSYLLGRVVRVEAPLVAYRQHNRNISLRSAYRSLKRSLPVLRYYALDARRMTDRFSIMGMELVEAQRRRLIPRKRFERLMLVHAYEYWLNSFAAVFPRMSRTQKVFFYVLGIPPIRPFPFRRASIFFPAPRLADRLVKIYVKLKAILLRRRPLEQRSLLSKSNVA